MDNDLIVELINSKSIKKNNINFNDKNIYSLWYDKTELEKILLGLQTNQHSYLSCFFSSIDDKFPELIDSYVMIFLKNPKILYGFVKVHSITLNDIPVKSYLEDIDEEYISQLKKNSQILIDDVEFNNVINKYKYIQVPKMFLVKFHYLYQFRYEIGIKKFNDFILNSNEIEKNNLEFKYPTKVQNKEMIKNSNLNFINNLMKYVDNLYNKEQTVNQDNISNISNASNISNIDLNKLSNNENNSVKNKFSIPVLWNCCECIKNMLVCQTTKPNKKIIMSHYLTCVDCEINDNNNKIINLANNKKITIKNINEDSDIGVFESLVNSYKNIESFNIENKIHDNFFEKDKINIISCSKSSSIYSKCLFLVE